MRQAKVSDITDLIETEVLIYIQDRLEREGLSLQHFNLPEPKVEHLVANEHRIIREETEFDFASLKGEVQNGYPNLNLQQKHVFYLIMNSIVSERGSIFCLNTSGGTGKLTPSTCCWQRSAQMEMLQLPRPLLVLQQHC